MEEDKEILTRRSRNHFMNTIILNDDFIDKLHK